MIPDAELLIGDYLREHPDVSALDARVAGRTPSSQTAPWVRITQLDAPSVGGHRSDRLIEFFLQFDCYAGAASMAAHTGQAEASTLTKTVREALRVLPDQALPGAVCTGVEFLSSPRLPDADFEPARERYALVANVWMHNSV